MDPDENPIHYCHGCQYCFGFLIELGELEEMDCE